MEAGVPGSAVYQVLHSDLALMEAIGGPAHLVRGALSAPPEGMLVRMELDGTEPGLVDEVGLVSVRRLYRFEVSGVQAQAVDRAVDALCAVLRRVHCPLVRLVEVKEHLPGRHAVRCVFRETSLA